MKFVKGRKSVILGVWAAPGAPETLPKGGGLRPPPFARVSRGPGAAQTPKMTDFRSLRIFKFYSYVQNAATPTHTRPKYSRPKFSYVRPCGKAAKPSMGTEDLLFAAKAAACGGAVGGATGGAAGGQSSIAQSTGQTLGRIK